MRHITIFDSYEQLEYDVTETMGFSSSIFKRVIIRELSSSTNKKSRLEQLGLSVMVSKSQEEFYACIIESGKIMYLMHDPTGIHSASKLVAYMMWLQYVTSRDVKLQVQTEFNEKTKDNKLDDFTITALLVSKPDGYNVPDNCLPAYQIPQPPIVPQTGKHPHPAHNKGKHPHPAHNKGKHLVTYPNGEKHFE